MEWNRVRTDREQMRNLRFGRVRVGKSKDEPQRGYLRGLRRVLGLFYWVSSVCSLYVLYAHCIPLHWMVLIGSGCIGNHTDENQAPRIVYE